MVSQSIYKNIIEKTSLGDFTKFSFSLIVEIYFAIDRLYDVQEKRVLVKKWVLGVLNLKLKTVA